METGSKKQCTDGLLAGCQISLELTGGQSLKAMIGLSLPVGRYPTDQVKTALPKPHSLMHV